MIRTLRALFLGRLLREKLLLVGFVLIGVLLWASSFSNRTGRLWRTQRATTTVLKEQQLWINNKPAIDRAAQKTADSLKPELTLDGLRLVAEVGELASKGGLHATSGATTKEGSGQFTINTVEFSVAGAEWDALKKFYDALQQRAPYIAVKELALNAQAGRESLPSLRVRVSSFEVTR
jgi:hypothetical protein